MMNLLREHKNIVGLGGIGILLLLGYLLFFRSSTPAPTTGQNGALIVTTVAAQGVGSDLVAILLKLQSLKLDTAVLKDPAFRSLNDFGREIPLEPVGRVNPFAPIGSE